MFSTRENTAPNSQERESSAERLRAFMQDHNLSLEDLAELLHTPQQTLVHWFDGGMAPPACLLALTILMDTLPQARSRLGAPSITVARDRSFDRAGGIQRVRGNDVFRFINR